MAIANLVVVAEGCAPGADGCELEDAGGTEDGIAGCAGRVGAAIGVGVAPPQAIRLNINSTNIAPSVKRKIASRIFPSEMVKDSQASPSL
jgi:hypothetical protein